MRLGSHLDCNAIKFCNYPFFLVYKDTKRGMGTIIGNTMGNCDKRTRAGAIYWMWIETATRFIPVQFAVISNA